MVDSSSIIQALIASGGGESGGNPLLEIHPGLIIWTVVIFTLLAIILGKFAWKPILKGLKDREQGIRESLEKADKVAADAEIAMAKQKADLDQQRQEMTEAMRRTREEAEKSAQVLLEKARKEAGETAEQARRLVEDERKKAVEQIRAEAVEISLAAAAHLIGKTLDGDDHRKIVSDYLKDLPTNLQKH
jgi:F-type H+-transporting ATPase subunit b